MKNCILVIFGASGDLTHRKLLPALAALDRKRCLTGGFRIFGLARSASDTAKFRAEARENLGGSLPPKTLERFLARLEYRQIDYSKAGDCDRLHDEIASCGGKGRRNRLLFHFAVPPETAETIIKTLSRSRFADNGRLSSCAALLVEKPFGMDLASARKLNRMLTDLCPEDHIYRIDHYLAKDTVRNIVVFRFANTVYEPVWNRNFIERIEISADESLGVGSRGGYYDRAGVVRDMIQNHVLQLLALIAMEPPDGPDAEAVRRKKHEVFSRLRPLAPDDWMLGQYRGYRETPGVAPDSRTPTFAALRLYVDNWRWAGVPFILRSGKAMKEKSSEITIVFRPVPLCVLASEQGCSMLAKNVLRIRIQPDEGIHFFFNVQSPGLSDDGISHADMHFGYRGLGEISDESYAKVVYDAMREKPTLFWRSDTIEEAWKLVDCMLSGPEFERKTAAFPNYEPGSLPEYSFSPNAG